MSIIYALVARANDDDLTYLCSYDMAHGNYPTICQEILGKAKIKESVIYTYNGQYNFHILKDGILLFVCMSAASFKNKVAFAFLQEIRKRFREKYSNEEILGAKDYDMSATFSDIFKTQIMFFNNAQGQDNKDLLMRELNSLTEGMLENVEKIVNVEEKMELIVKKTAKLDSIADEIKKNASKMKKEAFWKRNKCKLAMGGAIVVALLALIFII